jgi:hypothetical protein
MVNIQGEHLATPAGLPSIVLCRSSWADRQERLPPTPLERG